MRENYLQSKYRVSTIVNILFDVCRITGCCRKYISHWHFCDKDCNLAFSTPGQLDYTIAGDQLGMGYR